MVTREVPFAGLAYGSRRRSVLDLLERIHTLLGVSPRVDFGAPSEVGVNNSEKDPVLPMETFPRVELVHLDPEPERTAAWLQEHYR